MSLQMVISESDVISDDEIGDSRAAATADGRPQGTTGGASDDRDDMSAGSFPQPHSHSPSPDPEVTDLRCPLKFLLSSDQGDIPASTSIVLSTKQISQPSVRVPDRSLFSEISAVLSGVWVGLIKI